MAPNKIRYVGFEPGGKDMGATVTWKKSGLAFEATADSGYKVGIASSLDSGEPHDGFRPMEMMAVGLAGCTAMDMLSILQKKRQDVTDLEVKVHTHNAEEHPHVWTEVQIEYIVTGRNVEPEAVERAMQLSAEKYCPAQAMIRQAVDIELIYKIIDA